MRFPLLNASHDQGPGFFERGDDCEDGWWRHNDPMADGRLAEEKNERKKKNSYNEFSTDPHAYVKKI